MRPLVSIIVPVYNVETFLSECLKSLSEQTYKEIQVILIDDGSTDNSSGILNEFIKKEARAILFRQENNGVAAARQKGLELAKGDYIIHCDSDDFFTIDAIEKLVNSAVSNDADIVLADYYIKYKNKHIEVKVDIEGSALNQMLEGRLHGALWNKLIKKDALEGVFFEPGINYMEDYLFLFRALNGKDLKIKKIDVPVYYYRMRAGSYTGTVSSSSIKSASKVVSIVESEAHALVSKKSIEVMKAYNVYLTLMYGNERLTNEEKLKCLYCVKFLNFSWFKKVFLYLSVFNINFPVLAYRKMKSFINVPY